MAERTKNEGKRPQVFDFVTGLGGRDVSPSLITEIIEYTCQNERPEGEVIWVGMRG